MLSIDVKVKTKQPQQQQPQTPEPLKRPPFKTRFLALLDRLPFPLHLAFIVIIITQKTVSSTLKHLLYGPKKKSWSLGISFWHSLLQGVFIYSSPQSRHFHRMTGLLNKAKTPRVLYYKSVMHDDHVVIDGSTVLASLVRRGLDVEEDLSPPLSHGLPTGSERKVYGEWTFPKAITPAAATSPVKLILYCHGGGHVSMNNTTHRTITQALANKLDCSIFLPNYRLAPQNQFPSAVEDVLAAYLALTGLQASDCNVRLEQTETTYSPSEIIFVGDSAGGALIMQLLKCIKGLGLPMPARAVLLSPFLDHSISHKSWEENYDSCIMSVCTSGLRYQMEKYSSTLPVDHPAISPLSTHSTQDLLTHYPPILIQTGESETIADDSIAFYNRYNNIPSSNIRLELYKDMFHVFHILPFSRHTAIAMDRIKLFCTRQHHNGEWEGEAVLVDELGITVPLEK